jgi:hypothetical protein
MHIVPILVPLVWEAIADIKESLTIDSLMKFFQTSPTCIIIVVPDNNMTLESSKQSGLGSTDRTS